MKENYPKACKEVLEILKYMPKDDIEKIPKEIINLFEEKKDFKYKFSIKVDEDFSKLKILDETKAIMLNIFTNYLATEEQKSKIKAKIKKQKWLIEERKRQEFNKNDLFNKKKL